jgi:hypothetical protein
VQGKEEESIVREEEENEESPEQKRQKINWIIKIFFSIFYPIISYFIFTYFFPKLTAKK